MYQFKQDVYESFNTKLSRLCAAIERLYFAHDVEVKLESDRESWHLWLIVDRIEGDVIKRLYDICSYSLEVVDGKIRFHFTGITGHHYLKHAEKKQLC